MANLRALYQEVILDHNKKPRNFGSLEGANREAIGDNPLCGDHYEIHALVDGEGVIQDVRFEGQGCAISKAAASMMTVRVKGKPIDEARALVEEFRQMLTGRLDMESDHKLGHLTVFAGVAELPQRVKCAVLPWHALDAALAGEEKTSTEGQADVWTEE